MISLPEPYQSALAQEIADLLPDHPLYRLVRYHLEGGKGLRPALCLLACQGVGGDPFKAIPAAAAVELLHNFSLVHDDIQDRSPLRRHRPTLWQQWGEAQAITAGDALFALSRLALLRLKERGVSAGKVLQAARLLDEACLRLCQGQYLDMDFEGRPLVSRQEYLEMVQGKTSALMEASLVLGALVGGARKATVEYLRLMGRDLGLAFQLQDDVLGLWGETPAVGKVSPDIQRKKKVFPLVYALEASQGQDRKTLSRLYQQDSLGPEDVARVLAILDGLGARAYTDNLAQDYFRQAREHLKKARLSQPQGLREMLSYMERRQA